MEFFPGDVPPPLPVRPHDAGERVRAIAKAARKAHLSLADGSALTITRRRAGRGFVYRDETGRRIGDVETLARIRSLAIPPAYRDVRIAADPRAHLQAIGRDEAGRTQHRYHPSWTAVREERKAERLALIIDSLSTIRPAIRRDMASRKLSRDKALACAVVLMDAALIRVGGEAYARDNGSHGAATLLKRHVSITGCAVTLRFRGKGGKIVSCSLVDPALARALGRIGGLPGRRLLQFAGPSGEPQPINAGEVNAYLQSLSDLDISSKDFRMLGASAGAAEALATIEPATTEAARRRQIAEVMKAVAARLANTPAVVRKSYVHAAVVRSFETGALAEAHRVARAGRNRRRAENALGRIVSRMMRR
jgi:DNA topoisomerase I